MCYQRYGGSHALVCRGKGGCVVRQRGGAYGFDNCCMCVSVCSQAAADTHLIQLKPHSCVPFLLPSSKRYTSSAPAHCSRSMATGLHPPISTVRQWVLSAMGLEAIRTRNAGAAGRVGAIAPGALAGAGERGGVAVCVRRCPPHPRTSIYLHSQLPTQEEY